MTGFLSLDSKIERDSTETNEPPSKTVTKMYHWICISDLSYQATVFLV